MVSVSESLIGRRNDSTSLLELSAACLTEQGCVLAAAAEEAARPIICSLSRSHTDDLDGLTN